jgi:uncharacterized damage-inducible protein DinB
MELMNSAETLTTIFSHNLWANLRLLEKCAELSDEQLDASIVGTYGGIRNTLQHIITSERSYFSRISTGQRYDHPEELPPMTIAEMITATRITGDGLIEWAPKIQAGDSVEIDWDGTLRIVPKSILLTQVINHATEHRAQVMAIMTQIGVEPPDLQAWQYFDEQYQQGQ